MTARKRERKTMGETMGEGRMAVARRSRVLGGGASTMKGRPTGKAGRGSGTSPAA